MAARKVPATRAVKVAPPARQLADDIRHLIADARAHVAMAANATLTLLYWRIGRRIGAEVLGGARATYGEEIVVTLSRQLNADHGPSFDEKNLRRMLQFAEVFADEQIVVTLSRHLSWSHFLALLPLKQPLQREFYAEMCRVERWSVRTLRSKIGGMLYERMALSRNELRRSQASADLEFGDAAT